MLAYCICEHKHSKSKCTGIVYIVVLLCNNTFYNIILKKYFSLKSIQNKSLVGIKCLHICAHKRSKSKYTGIVNIV